MAAVTLATLRARARERADMVNSGFVADTATSLDAWINEGCQELHEFLTRLYGNEYEGKQYAFSTVAGQDSYDLPADFYKLLALDVVLYGWNIDVPKFNLKDRNKYHRPINTSWGLLGAPHYRIVGRKLYMFPVADAVYSMTMWYVPQLQVTKPASLALATPAAASTDTIVIDGVTITGYSSEDIAGLKFHASTGGYTPTQVATSIAAVINGNTQAQFGGNVTATSSGATVYIIGASTITFGAGNFILYPSTGTYVAAQSVNKLVTDYDSVNLPDGLERYVPIYAAIQALKKEESDSRPLENELGSLREHITAALAPRDANEPDTAADVVRREWWR